MNRRIQMNANYARVLCLLLFLLPCTLNAFAGWKCVREKDEFGHTFEGGITRSKEGYTLSLYRIDGRKSLRFFLDMDKSRKWFKTGKEFPAEISLFIDGEWRPMQTTLSFLYGLNLTGTSSHSAELPVSISSSDAAFFLKATKMSIKVKCLDDEDYTMRFDISGTQNVYDFVGLDVEYPPSFEHLSSKQQTYDFDKGSFSCSETWKLTSDNDGNLITVQGTIGNEAAFVLCVSNDVIDNGFPSLSEAEKRDMLRLSVGETPVSIENSTYSYTKFKDETAIRITGKMDGLYADMVVTILQHRLVAYIRLADSKAKLSHKAFNTISQTLSVTPFIVDKNKVHSDLKNDAQFLEMAVR